MNELRAIINRSGVEGLFDPHALDALTDPNFFNDEYDQIDSPLRVSIEASPVGIDLDPSQPYAGYNWELFFHAPLMVAVHLSKNQRFAEADRWFRYIFDPSGTGSADPVPDRFWRFPAFHTGNAPDPIFEQIELLAKEEAQLTEAESLRRQALLNALSALRRKPFQPYAAARAFNTRAFQWQAVMKYLDNLIAWGDYYFTQDTMETLDLARQRYVMAANVLGPRPERIESSTKRRARSFRELADAGVDELGNTLVELETSFPFNVASHSGTRGSGAATPNGGDGASDGALLGLGRTLYFCVPPNDRLLRYWDTVSDRLYKLRHCMNIKGMVRPLALFDPPLDPGMLVKAAAAGIDVSSIVAGLHQPPSPVRARNLLGRAIALANELRTYGQAVQTALEREDAEALSLLRQQHELRIAELQRDSRFIAWKQAEAATEALVRSRDSTRLKYEYTARLVGFEVDRDAVPETPALLRSPFTEESFDEAYDALVKAYDLAVPKPELPTLTLAKGGSPGQAAGAEGTGPLYLIPSEDAELNIHLPAARDFTLDASVAELVAPILGLFPDFNIDLHYWGLGASSTVFGGTKLAAAAGYVGEILRTQATWEKDQAGIAARTSGFERRADEWLQQVNTTGAELQALGCQIIASLIAEEAARHEYEMVGTQIEHDREIDEHLREKFSNKELYAWMQGEAGRLFYEYYRMALDLARRAERAVKAEVMRPALDETDFVAFNHWDGGRRGLLSGDRLLLDLRRLEDAYDEHNTRDHVPTRHVSLRQLDPISLLQLKVTGSCEFTIPEWFFDLDRPGHYLRRIQRVEVTTDPVLAPQTPVHLTASLVRSTVRTSPLAGGQYAREEDDDRFVDYVGPVESIVTSSGVADAGYNPGPSGNDQKGPFEFAGAVSKWCLELPAELRQFDYRTLTDVMLTVTFTAREGGAALAEPATMRVRELLEAADESQRALLISLRHDQPSDWATFRSGNHDFPVQITRQHLPFWAQREGVELGDEIQVIGVHNDRLVTKTVAVPQVAADEFTDNGATTVDIPSDNQVMPRDARDIWILVPYHLQ